MGDSMTNQQILDIALQQSAYDCNCSPGDFLRTDNVVVVSSSHPRARNYLSLPFDCDLVSYGSNIVAQVSEPLREIVAEYINRPDIEHCFETPAIHILDAKLQAFGLKTCFLAEYFLPDVERMEVFSCAYPTKVLHKSDFASLYLPEWSNALCEKRKNADVLAVGAYDGEKLIGLAGCSADCEEMYQIGVDVLPEYRRQGVAEALTSLLAREVLALGKVPFYCAAWSNIKSVRNAIRCGFYPAWVELTVRKQEYIDEMNRKKA